ncbi:MAG: YqaJ viral recombinase family protein, partial [Nitrososphaeraceae archaeon]|nr:YqaJ viral recombinase family protein [Nitrososphaeraceae archaeon]
MSKKSISYDKRIKKIIEENHDGNFYETQELTTIINNILTEVKKDYDTDHATLADSITYFVYYSDKTDKYFLNHKRRNTKKKDYHETLLNKLIDKPEQVGVFEVNEKNNSEEKNENIEPTSEELILLEKEIFNKKEKIIIKEIEITNENNNEEEEDNEEIENMKYLHPTDKPFQPNKKYYYEPYGTQWVHDIQNDDVISEREIKLGKQFDILRAIVLPEQRSAAWFEMRDGKITASDGGTVLDVNPHEQQYKFIFKKTVGIPFISNEYVHHGKKLEEIAILIYEYRMNVKCEAFGLIGHPKYKFLGASPDSICGKFKLDGGHKSKFIGRMLEIKCPFIRKIKTEGPIIDHICPIYYWVQVQLQLECCDLDECDFWQCEIREYDSRDDFLEDTHPIEPYRSKEHSYEKGCLIQLLPR